MNRRERIIIASSAFIVAITGLFSPGRDWFLSLGLVVLGVAAFIVPNPEK